MRAGETTVDRAETTSGDRISVPKRRARRAAKLDLSRVYMGLRFYMDLNLTAQQILEGDSGETMDTWRVLIRDMRQRADELDEGLQNRNVSPTPEVPPADHQHGGE